MNQQLHLSNKTNSGKELPIFVKWLEFLKWFLPTLEKFPKKFRFTLSTRMENLSLELVELLIEAKYSKEKGVFLRKANLNLEKIRILMRISHELKIMPTKSYHFASKQINEVGTMLGGWMKSHIRS